MTPSHLHDRDYESFESPEPSGQGPRSHAGHSHGGHSHGIRTDADQRYLIAGLVLLGLFMAGEVVAALLSGSLALLSDAGHMISDVAAIAIALWAMRLAERPAHGAWTWGWHRAEILSAAVNGITMLVVGVVVAIEAIERLITPPQVKGGPVLIVALIGVAVNVAVAWLVAHAHRSSLNVEGAYQHIVTDLYGFIATVIAGVVMLFTTWTRADAIASLVVAALMLHAAWRLLAAAGRILLEAAPEGVDVEHVRAHLLEKEHIVDVHDIHMWSITAALPAVSAHVVVEESCFHDGHVPELLAQVRDCLADHFDIEHSTFQFERPAHRQSEKLVH